MLLYFINTGNEIRTAYCSYELKNIFLTCFSSVVQSLTDVVAICMSQFNNKISTIYNNARDDAIIIKYYIPVAEVGDGGE